MLSQKEDDKWTELKLWRRGKPARPDFLHAYWMGRYYGFITKGEWHLRMRAQLDAKNRPPELQSAIIGAHGARHHGWTRI